MTNIQTHTHTIGLTVSHRVLYSILWNEKKNLERVAMCICMTIHSAIPLKLTQHVNSLFTPIKIKKGKQLESGVLGLCLDGPPLSESRGRHILTSLDLVCGPPCPLSAG